MSKNGQEIGQEHAKAVEAYVKDLWKRQEPLPRRAGRPNLTRIATACGFDRGVFYANDAVERALDEYEAKDRIRFYDKLEQAALDRDKTEASSKQNKAIMDRIIELEALVQSQARELERLRRLEKLMCSEGILPP